MIPRPMITSIEYCSTFVVCAALASRLEFTMETESVNMAVVACDKKFSFQPLFNKKFISLSGKDLQESLVKWYL